MSTDPLEYEITTCPYCGTPFPERDADTEPIYECVVCGAEGFDCCIAGTGALCPACQLQESGLPDEDEEA